MSNVDRLGKAFEVFGASKVPITLADLDVPDAPLFFVNQAFSDMCGYAVDDLLGKNCRLLQPEDIDDAAKEPIRKMLADPTQMDGMACIPNVRADGRLFTNLVILKRLRGVSPSIVLGSQFDVTDTVPLQSSEVAAGRHAEALMAALDETDTLTNQTVSTRVQVSQLVAETMRTIAVSSMHLS